MAALTEVLARFSGLSELRGHLRLEVPILLGTYWALNFVLRPGKFAPFVAALPIVVFYTGYDIFFVALGTVFKIDDFQSFPELLKVLPFARQAAMLLILGVPVVLVLGFLDYRRYRRLLGMGALAALLVLTVELRPGVILKPLDWAGFNLAEFSDMESVNANGRLTMTLYYEARRKQAFAETASYRNRGNFQMQVQGAGEYIRKHGNRRNVHLIVLESFLDPTLFKAVTFSKDPRHPDFAKLVGNGQSISISPVFGGQTAQAEFEVLCGVPALQMLSEIEFNHFSGEAAGCMPGILARAGYSTIVSNAFQPNYFNSTRAYTGIGFQKLYFPLEYSDARSTYLTIANVSEKEDYLFDGDLFDQNLAFITRTLHDNPGRPVLNYVLGIYGHEPHDMDPGKQPKVLTVNAPHDDGQLLGAANQYWYRTEAIARYVRALIKLDPKGLIIIVSDHLPPLDQGVKSYRDFRYLDNINDSTHMNRILIVKNGKVVRHKTIHHYDVPALIYDYLTGNSFCAKNNCELSDKEREEKYMSLMAHAVGIE
jgi:hypothetical protein